MKTFNPNPRALIPNYRAAPILPQAAPSARGVEHCRELEGSPADLGKPLVIAISAHPEAGAQCHCDFDVILMNLLGDLANCPSGQLQRELEAAFRRICQFLGVEHAGLWCCLSKDAKSITLTHLYPRLENVPSQIQGGNAFKKRTSLGAAATPGTFPLEIGEDLKARFPWISSQVNAGRCGIVQSDARLPPAEAERDKQALEQLRARSAMVVPIQMDSSVVGALNFALSHQERKWPGPFVERLKLVAQVLASGVVRKLREEELAVALKEAREFKVALDAYAIVAITDAQGQISYVNDKFCDLAKYSREELLGRDHRIINSGYHSKEFFRDLWTTIAKGQVWRGEIKNRAKDGSSYWVETTIVPLLSEQGKPREYISIQVDIAERKLAEETLTRSYAEIKQLKDRLQAETAYLKTEIKISQSHGEMIGRSQALKRVLHQVEQVAPVDCTVLITGETRTGKELVARAIHRLSSRKERVMVVVNCAALPAPLVESELFGRERGAFTGALTSEVGRFEVADGSTIFLDEIGELSLETQAKLLRILQEGEFQRLGSPRTRKVNLRVIAATNKDLTKEVRGGRFREDLFYRLRVFPIDVPPLRQRIEDIPLLVSSFVEEFSSRMGKQINRIPRKLLETLEQHPWPGNIRELRNIIERGVILSTGETLTLPNVNDSSGTTLHPTSLADVEREHILKTLGDSSWRVKGPYGAAKRLQMKPSTLYSRMAKLGVHRAAAKLTAPGELTHERGFPPRE